mgnify:CR=1 FL=1
MINPSTQTDILPNVFIQNVDLYDHDDENYKVMVKVYFQLSGNSEQLVSETLGKNLKILFFASGDSGVANSIRSGQFDLNEINLKQFLSSLPQLSRRKYVAEYRNALYKDPIMVSSLTNESGIIMNSNAPSDSALALDNECYYHDYEFIIRKTSGLSVFTCLYLDSNRIRNVAVESGFQIQLTQNDTVRGPVFGEVILEAGSIAENTTAFVLPNGQQYAGPVHVHNGVYMEGSFHSDEPHRELTLMSITNFKVKDYRKNTFFRSPVLLPSSDVQCITSAFYSANGPKAHTTGFFSVNFLTLIKNFTKYGHLLKDESLAAVIKAVRIKLLTVSRHKIKIRKNSNSLGTSEISEASTIETVKIVELTGNATDGFHSITRDKDFHNLSTIRTDEGQPLQNSGTITAVTSDVDTAQATAQESERVADIREINFGGDFAKYFEFNDYSLNMESPGDYKYSVEITFIDPTIEYIKNIESQCKQNILSLLEQRNALLVKSNYDSKRDRSRRSFYQISSHDTNIVTNFVEYSSLVYNLNQTNRQDLFNYYIKKNHTRYSNIKAHSTFLDDYYKLYNEMSKIFEFEKIVKNTHISTKKSQLKNENFINLIKVGRRFNEIITPSVYRTGCYSFIEEEPPASAQPTAMADLPPSVYTSIPSDYEGPVSATAPSGMSRVSGARMASRITQEVSKFWNSTAEITRTEVNISDDNIANALTAVPPAKMVDTIYFSPRKVETFDGSPVDLSSVKNLNQEHFRRTMENSKSIFTLENERFSKINRRAQSPYALDDLSRADRQEDAISAQLIENASRRSQTDEGQIFDYYSTSAKYLGVDSEFVNGEGSEDNYKATDEDGNLEADAVKIEAGILATIYRSYPKPFEKKNWDLSHHDNLLNKVAKYLPVAELRSEVENLPMQIKSLFLGRSPKVKNKFMDYEYDPFSGIDTQLAIRANFLTLAKVEYLNGFSGDSMTPIFSTTPNEFGGVSNVCRFSYYTNEKLNLDGDVRTFLPIKGKYFLMDMLPQTTAGVSTANNMNEGFTSMTSQIVRAADPVYDIEATTTMPIVQARNRYNKHLGPLSEPMVVAGSALSKGTAQASPNTGTSPSTGGGGSMTGGGGMSGGGGYSGGGSGGGGGGY